MSAQLGKNSLWLVASRLSTMALMALFTILLARRLGNTGFGEYAILAATIFIGNMLTTFGTDMLLVREIAAHGDLSRLPAALMLQLGLSVLFVIGVFFGGPMLPNLSTAALLGLRIYSLALFPLAFSTIFSIALRGSEQMGAYALLSLASVLVQLGVVLALPTLNIPLLAVWLTIAQCVVALVAGVLCILKIPGFQRGWQFSTRAFRPLLVSAAPIALLALLGILYQKLGIYLLSSLAGAAITGSFAVALRAVEASKTIHNSVFTALYPAMARAGAGSTSAYRLAWVPLLAGAVLISLLLSVFAGPFVSVLFGLEFAPSAPALRILAWILLPYTLNTYLTLAFLVAKKERCVAAASFGSLLALLLLNIWWTPTHGLLGAAWAALVAECLQAFLLWAQRGFHLEVIERGEPHELSQLS